MPTSKLTRRYLIELPLKWYAKLRVLTSVHNRIYQTHLKETGIKNSCVRVSLNYGAHSHFQPTTYYYTKKISVALNVNKEYDDSIEQWRYRELLDKRDRTKYMITKVRYNIDFDNRKFNLDIFEENLLGLAILEIEVKDMNENILLPPYLKVIKEITTDNFYYVSNLANLSSYSYSVEGIRFPRRID